MKEFIECPNDDCETKMRWDGEGEMTYFCANCATELTVEIAPDPDGFGEGCPTCGK